MFSLDFTEARWIGVGLLLASWISIFSTESSAQTADLLPPYSDSRVVRDNFSSDELLNGYVITPRFESDDDSFLAECTTFSFSGFPLLYGHAAMAATHTLRVPFSVESAGLYDVAVEVSIEGYYTSVAKDTHLAASSTASSGNLYVSLWNSRVNVSDHYPRTIWDDEYDIQDVLNQNASNVIEAIQTHAVPGSTIIEFADAAGEILSLYNSIQDLRSPQNTFLHDEPDSTFVAEVPSVFLRSGEENEIRVSFNSTCWSGSFGVGAYDITHSEFDVRLNRIGLTYLGCPDSRSLSVSAGSNGTVSPSGSIDVCGDVSQTLTASPALGYVVNRWYVNGAVVAEGIQQLELSEVVSGSFVEVTFSPESLPPEQTETYTASDSTTIIDSNLDANYDGRNFVSVHQYSGFPGTAHALIRFNDVDGIPIASSVQSAELRMYCTDDFGPSSDLFVSPITSSWRERSVTWRDRPSYGNRTLFADSNGSDAWWSWDSDDSNADDLKAIVQEWVDDPDVNEGVVVRATHNDDSAIFSSDDASSSFRPKLVVSFVPAPPGDFIVERVRPNPVPVGNVFYVEDNSEWDVRVENVSAIGTSSPSDVRYFITPDPDQLDDSFNTETIPALLPGENAETKEDHTFTPEDVGTRYVVAVVNSGLSSPESVTENNSGAYGPFEVRDRSGRLRVDIQPQSAASSAGWRLTSGPDNTLHGSGEYSDSIPVGTYPVAFEDVAGYETPASRDLVIGLGDTHTSTFYVPLCVCSQGECCDGCNFLPSSTSCSTDQNVCTDDVCDGGGLCLHIDNSTSCDDGDPNTINDVCENGSCSGEGRCDGVVCIPLDQCHSVGVCDAATGVCSTPNQPDASACDDLQFCTDVDRCVSGVCIGEGTPCDGPDDDNDCAESCDELSNGCTAPDLDGTSCNDSCSPTATCSEGVCSGDGCDWCETCTGEDGCEVSDSMCKEEGECFQCGQPSSEMSVRPTLNDVSFVLAVSVGLGECSGCVCNVDGDAGVSAVDALWILRTRNGLDAGEYCGQ